MRVVGVICEYNPFHRGHAFHLREARRRSGADFVVCVMSGALTQRGTFARHSKFLRASMALRGGADLVLELPVRFACAPAADFAAGGAALLGGLGVVTHLSFGCEAQAIPALAPAAALRRDEPPALREALRQALDAGLSYPQAYSAAAAACGLSALTETLALPNATLALEYLLAMPAGMEAVPVPRAGGGHNDAARGEMASAGAVRAALARGDGAAYAALPFAEDVREAEVRGLVHEEEALTQALLFVLRGSTARELGELYGADEGIEHRLLRAARQAGDRETLLRLADSRRVTRARLSRLCAAALLGLTKETARRCSRPASARILGFRRTALPLLHAIRERGTLPLVAKCADMDRTDPLFALDVRAQDLWALGCTHPSARAAGSDFITSPIVCEPAEDLRTGREPI